MTAADLLRVLMDGQHPHALCSANGTGTFRCDGHYASVDELLAAADKLTRQHRDVWFGVHGLNATPDSGRGGDDDVAEVRVLHADIDWDHDAHADPDLLDENETRARLARLKHQPSYVIHTGHGLHIYWLLAVPVTPERGAELLGRMHAALRAVGLKPERDDLASVLRVPGTVNYKADPVDVGIAEANPDRRYQPEYLDKHLPNVAGTRAGTCAGGKWRDLSDEARAALDWRNRTSLELLEAMGGHDPFIQGDVVYVVGPNSHADRSASIGYDTLGPGAVKVFTSSWKPLVKDRVYSLDELEHIVNGDREQHGDSGATPSFFTARGALVVEIPGGILQQEGTLRTGIDGRIYQYTNGVYTADGESWGRRRLRELLGDRWKRAHADEVIVWLRAAEPFIGAGTPSPGFLNVTNGLLRLDTLDLRAHTPKVPTTVQLPVAWNPDAACPAVTAFLGQVLPGVPLEFVFETVGYTLYPANLLALAFMLLGTGANGKSVFLQVLRSLIGATNYSVVPLQHLAENRFAGAELFGKLANICGDIDARAIKRTDLFKQITGGDPIQAERKYGHPFAFTAYATPWFSANEAPITSDQSDAWFRRWIILPFTQQFEGSKADPFLARRLTAADELEGLLVAAVHGLRRVMARGRFDPPGEVAAAGDRYRDKLDTIRTFVEEECTFSPDQWVARSDLYRAYKEWCGEQGRMAVSATNFNERLLATHGDHIQLRIVRGDRRWVGIGKSTPWP